MSPAETEREQALAAEQPAARSCPQCGAPLAPEQDWCLSCGAPASTRIAATPSWRAPLAIVGTVLVLAAAALTVAFLSLTDDAERVAQTPEPTPTAQPTEAPPVTPSPEATVEPLPDETPAPPAGVGTWPEGEEAWTVIVLSTSDETGARAKAQELADGGTQVGVLNSSDYSSLRSGFWVVFSGQYETSEEAQAAAAGLAASAPGAYARFVAP